MEAQGIKTVLLDSQSLGYMGFAGQVRLMAERDADYEPAMRIVRELQMSAPVGSMPSSWKVQRWGCAGMVAGFGFLVAGSAATQDESRALAYGLIAGAVALFAIGLALIIFGPRRDRSQSQ